MTKRMLIDGVHPEQTRVVVMDDRRLLEFDTEIASQKTLKGNIYLAKITRVEPSLQAAFVDYGGNRHGFLPFSEIHADYYRIPVADREALKASQRQRGSHGDDLDDDEEDSAENDGEDFNEADDVLESAGGAGLDLADSDDPDDGQPDAEDADEASSDADAASNGESDGGTEDGNGKSIPLAADVQDPSISPDSASDTASETDSGADAAPAADANDVVVSDADAEQSANGEEGSSGRQSNRRGRRNGRNSNKSDRDDERRRSPRTQRRAYTIQEVIKRGQIMLIQVVKEERGTKGAAVTTYLSLAGRYCVLMPNTARGGGISRKITNGKDRSRLKEIVGSLEIQDSMAVIVRTAGIGRTKTEIKRDYDFLAKSWERVRDETLQSRAPVLIYEESGLIKRTLRDSYTREIEEVIIQGDAAYREAKDFMKSLMPSHAKRVQPYKDASPPLFHRFNVDAQLHRLHSPIVQLPSGGYLVINMTEALVAIDINSGRSTRERHIEETALKTNLEAADEIGRQLRLRDLAGLIVIDFIDMEDRRANYSVERRLKDAMQTDRARVQIGRISPLGLLELSRQRLRPSLLESVMEICPICAGLGRVASTSSSALQVLSTIEDEGMRARAGLIRVHLAAAVAFYILNEKREELVRIERDYGLRCMFEPDESLIPPNARIEILQGFDAQALEGSLVDATAQVVDVVEPEEEEEEQPTVRRRGRRKAEEPEAETEEQDQNRRRRGRRSSRRRRDEDSSDEAATNVEQASPEDTSADSDSDGSADSDRGRNRRRRRRRRGRGEARSPLPGVAVFSRSATPLAWHVAAEEAAEQEAPVEEAQQEQPAESPAELASASAPAAEVTDSGSSADANAVTAPETDISNADAPVSDDDKDGDETVAAMLMPVAQAMDKAPGTRRPRRRRASRAKTAKVATESAADATEMPEATDVSDAVVSEVVVPEAHAPEIVEPEVSTPIADEPVAEVAEVAPEAAELADAEPAPEAAETAPVPEPESPPVETPKPDDAPTRRGWWQRLLD